VRTALVASIAEPSKLDLARRTEVIASADLGSTNSGLKIGGRAMNDDIDYESLDDALDLIAAWLLAAYGPRLERVALSLESYYGPLSECFGIVSMVLDRGVRSDGSPETRETMPSREVCGHAEVLFTRLYPMVRFTRESVRDVRHAASSRTFAASDVSAHRPADLDALPQWQSDYLRGRQWTNECSTPSSGA
jgi:hypothetical protein